MEYLSLDTLIWGVIALAGMGLMVACAFIFLPNLIGKVKQMGEAMKSEPAEVELAPEITNMLGNIERTLMAMERRGDRARVLLTDAQVQTAMLVGLIQGFIHKIEEFRVSRANYEAALIAMTSGEHLDVVKAATKLSDPVLCKLLMTPTRDPNILLGVQKVLAAEIGTLDRWEQHYLIFSERLLADVAGYRNQMADLQATLQLYGAAEPMARVQHNLTQAQGYLQIATDPKASRGMRQLPTVAARTLTG